MPILCQHLYIPYRPNNAPTPQEHEVTARSYDDGSLNIAYSKIGETVPLDVENHGDVHDPHLPPPYYMVGLSGTCYYISPGHGGVGVMLTDRTPNNPDPDKKVAFRILNGKPPHQVTLGKECFIPGLKRHTEPIIQIVKLFEDNGDDSIPKSAHMVHISKVGNPILRLLPKFDAAVARG